MRLAVVMVLLVARCCVAGALEAQPPATELTELRSADSTWQAASAARDVARMMAHYAPGASADFGGRVHRGHEAIRALWVAEYRDTLYRLTWVNSRAELMAGTYLAYTIGTWRLTAKGGERQGTYFAVWQRQSDGRWLVLIDTAR